MDEIIEEELECLDPHPDIHALFVHYSALYFEDKLGACSVEWSSARMTLCGGICEFATGGGCRIKLSEPLLKLRPSRDLKEVLLHEMIHAYMMLGGIRDDEPSGHGTIFKSIMRRINASKVPDSQRPPDGYNIDTHHTMVAEVDHYRQHHWKCERCGHLVKRAMNRPPQEADCRGRQGKGADCRDPYCHWHLHLRNCGGAFLKIKQPEGYVQKGKKGKKSASAAGLEPQQPHGSRGLPPKRPKSKGGSRSQDITKFFGRGQVLGGADESGSSGDAGGGTGEEAGAGRSAAAAASALAASVGTSQLIPHNVSAHPAFEALASAAQGHGASSSQQKAPGGGRGSTPEELPPVPQAVHGISGNSGPLPDITSQGNSGVPAAQGQQAQLSPPTPQPPSASMPNAEPSAAERRQLHAEAALRRPGGQAAAPQQEAHQAHLPQQQGSTGQQMPQRETAVGQPSPVDPMLPPLLRSPHQRTQQPVSGVRAGSPLVPFSVGGQPLSGLHPQQQEQAEEVIDVQDLTWSPPEAGSTHSAQEGASLQCPVCGRCWGAVELSYEALNAHIDECLTLGFLQQAPGVL